MLLKVDEVAQILGCCRETVWRHARMGTLKSVRFGRNVRFPSEQFEEMLGSMTKELREGKKDSVEELL